MYAKFPPKCSKSSILLLINDIFSKDCESSSNLENNLPHFIDRILSGGLYNYQNLVSDLYAIRNSVNINSASTARDDLDNLGAILGQPRPISLEVGYFQWAYRAEDTEDMEAIAGTPWKFRPQDQPNDSMGNPMPEIVGAPWFFPDDDMASGTPVSDDAYRRVLLARAFFFFRSSS